MIAYFTRTLLAGVVLLFAAFSAAAADIPYLSGRVVDDAEILTSAVRARLGEMLKAHEKRTTNQIAVLTVPTIQGASIEEYALAVFEQWKLGQKDQDNGVLVVVVPNDRRMRIEVGYGLEGTLTDVAAGRIIRNIMTPRFKDGDYGGGVEDGVAAIVAMLEGRDTIAAGPADSKPDEPALSSLQVPDLPLAERILLGAFIFGIIGLFTAIGIVTPGMGWFLYLFLIPFWAMFPIVIVGTEGALILFVIYLVGFPLAKLLFTRSAWYENAQRDLKTKGHARIGGFALGSSSSGGSSWSSSSSRSSSSSFSGGGGRSGGGGSSGSW